jgi:hypothetical protein
LLFFLNPETLLELKFRDFLEYVEYVEYVEAKKNEMRDPDNKEFQIITYEARLNMNIGD